MDGEKNKPASQRKSISLMFHVILSIPKTIYFNFRCFPFGLAAKMPVMVSHKVKLLELHRGIISFGKRPKRFSVKIGFGGSDAFVPRKGCIALHGGHVVFNGKASFAEGFVMRSSGELTFGKNFFANVNCSVRCSDKITFGDDVLLGCDVLLRDSDGHTIVKSGVEQKQSGDISIGDHTWLCAESRVLKNSALGKDCVLGFGSLLTKKYDMNNALFAGVPAKPINEDINWIH